jgi:hypothetical protein
MSSYRSEAFSVWRRSTRVGCLIDEDLIMGASGGVRSPQHHWLRPRGLSGRTCRWLIAIYRATVPNARYRFAKQGGCHPSLTRCRTALLAQFQFQLGDRGHDAGDGAPRRRAGVHPFPQRPHVNATAAQLIKSLLAEGLKGRLRPDLRVHLAAAEAEFWESPDFSRTHMPPGVPDVLRSVASRFLDEYRSQLRPFEAEYEVAPGVVACRTGGHTPGHSVVRLASGGDRLTFAGDAVFQVGFDRPEWYNGFEHDPEEAARVRVRLLQELAATREPLVATHLPFPSVCRVAVAGNAFRCVPAVWDY